MSCPSKIANGPIPVSLAVPVRFGMSPEPLTGPSPPSPTSPVDITATNVTGDNDEGGSQPGWTVATSSTVNVAPPGAYQSITIDPGRLIAGTSNTLTIKATAKPGILDPGPVTLSDDLGQGVRIMNPGTCQEGADDTTVCVPTGKTTTWTVPVEVGPKAVEPWKLPTVAVNGDSRFQTSAAEGARLSIEIRQCASDALRNGDFEDPKVPVKNGFRFVGPTPPRAWCSTAPQIEFWTQGAQSNRNNGGRISAVDGQQWVELNSSEADGIFQEIRVIPGQTLTWTVSHRARANSPAKTNEAQVLIGGVDSTGEWNSSVVATMSDGSGAWREYNGEYHVPPGQTLIRFELLAVSPTGSYGNFVDAVTVVASG